MFSVFVFENFVTPIIERRAHLRESNRTLRDGSFLGGGAIPGTSYQATIASSLRDISQQDLAALPLHHARLSLPTNYQLTSSSCRECPLARPVGTTPIVAWHEVPAKASLERTVPQGTV